jgi:geranylgeranylglycerol-phosphate geranylgeranyltransferase
MASEKNSMNLNINANKRDRNIDGRTVNNKQNREKAQIKPIIHLRNNLQSFVSSQTLLLQSRKKWAIIFTLATMVGIFNTDDNKVMMIQSMTNYDYLTNNLPYVLIMISKIMLLPIISFSIIVGMYVFNDLIDADLDKINGKKRPIPMKLVSNKQAWIFIILSNGLGIILSIITLSSNSVIMTSMLDTIGILYSIPKIALKDRFIVKTLSISSAMMLCLMIGSSAVITTTSTTTTTTNLHNNNNNNKHIMNPSSTTIIKNQKLSDNDHSSFGNPTEVSISNPIIVPIYSALMLGIMVFITSPFNDLGDISGDEAVGRKTIPVVIGKENTVKLAISLAASLSIISIMTYSLFPTSIGVFRPIFVSMTSIIITMTMAKTLKHINEPDIVSRFLKKKTLPLHMILQASLMAGSMLLFLFSQ